MSVGGAEEGFWRMAGRGKSPAEDMAGGEGCAALCDSLVDKAAMEVDSTKYLVRRIVLFGLEFVGVGA